MHRRDGDGDGDENENVMDESKPTKHEVRIILRKYVIKNKQEQRKLFIQRAPATVPYFDCKRQTTRANATQLAAVVRLRSTPIMSLSVYLEMHSFIVSHTGSERLVVTG